MAAEKRKPTIFNMECPREKALHEFAESHIRNYSGWVKKNLEALAKRMKVEIPPKPDAAEPSPKPVRLRVPKTSD